MSHGRNRSPAHGSYHQNRFSRFRYSGCSRLFLRFLAVLVFRSLPVSHPEEQGQADQNTHRNGAYGRYTGERAVRQMADPGEDAGENRDHGAERHARQRDDQQSFNPHITLIRKPILPREEILTSINVPPTSMIVKEICLYQSVHEADGMKYNVIGKVNRGPKCFRMR